MNKALHEYRYLHEFVSDMIESGRLTEDMVPDDYHALVEQLIRCIHADPERDSP